MACCDMLLYYMMFFIPSVIVNRIDGDHQITGGDLPSGIFHLQQFHFHVGGSDGQGSEHTIDGQTHPMEVNNDNNDEDENIALVIMTTNCLHPCEK